MKAVWVLIGLLVLTACQSENPEDQMAEEKDEKTETEVPEVPVPEEEPSYILPEVDLSHWKVTLPIGENDRPIEVEPPEILEYGTNETLKPFMYNDSINGALVFYTYPGATTPNSSRSRTELREQMEPGSNSVNWTFAQGGRLKGTLQMDEISKDAGDNYHRTIIMQIHGRLTNEQRDMIGGDDNNAPPMLKIYWYDGKVRVKTKVLKSMSFSDEEILYTDSWTDDEGFNFTEEVGFDKFSLEVLVEEGRMEVILNDSESVVYDDENIEKWGVFENYFKAGNYLQTSEEGAFARIKIYDLEVSHE